MALASTLLPGKVVAITGCSTGIGRAVALGKFTAFSRLMSLHDSVPHPIPAHYWL